MAKEKVSEVEVIEQNPVSGGRWIRQTDGSLVREPLEQTAPAPETGNQEG